MFAKTRRVSREFYPGAGNPCRPCAVTHQHRVRAGFLPGVFLFEALTRDNGLRWFDMMVRLWKGKTSNAFVQFVRYLLVGVAVLFVDLGWLFVLTEWIGLYYLHSATWSFLLGLATCYLLSIFWVFDHRSIANAAVEFVIFVLLGLAGLGLNLSIIYLLTDGLGLHYLGSKGFATVAIVLWNFGSRKILLFTARTRHVPGECNQVDVPRSAALTRNVVSHALTPVDVS
jgi:putative flippase GtrA